LGHINLNPLRVHREHIIGLVLFQGNSTPLSGEENPTFLGWAYGGPSLSALYPPPHPGRVWPSFIV